MKSNNITTPPSRVRGLSVELMKILYRFGALSCSEIAHLIDKKCDYIKKYLYNLHKYGFLIRKECLWDLSEKGLLFIERKGIIDDIYRKIYIEGERRITERGKLGERRITERGKLTYKRNISSGYHRDIINFMVKTASKRYKLSEIEGGVVLLLLENYFNSGRRRKFMYFKSQDDVSSFFKLDFYTLRDTLISLHNKGIVYFKLVMGLMKIGLMKDFIRELEDEVKEVEGKIR